MSREERRTIIAIANQPISERNKNDQPKQIPPRKMQSHNPIQLNLNPHRMISPLQVILGIRVNANVEDQR